MNATIADLMSKRVITVQRHHSVDHVRGLMLRNRVHAVPVVDTEGRPVGIVTSTDLVPERDGGAPVSTLMATEVRTVPAYNAVHVAARIMRHRRIHHVVVTHEKKVVGLISSFDLLKLVEDHHFVAKSAALARHPRTRRA
jgi:CBS domain-containing protein